MLEKSSNDKRHAEVDIWRMLSFVKTNVRHWGSKPCGPVRQDAAPPPRPPDPAEVEAGNRGERPPSAVRWSAGPPSALVVVSGPAATGLVLAKGLVGKAVYGLVQAAREIRVGSGREMLSGGPNQRRGFQSPLLEIDRVEA